MKKIHKISFLLFLLFLTVNSFGQIPNLFTYNWPTSTGQAILSNKYKVTLIQNGVTVSTKVICSNSKDVEIPNYAQEMRGGRTFNWTMFSYDYSLPLTVVVEDLFSTTVSDVEIFPSNFNISKTLSNGNKKVQFTLSASKYVSINFKSSENLHTSDGVVKHMLMIFADNLETEKPSKTAAGTHVYSATSTANDLANATVLYFPRGYHNLSRFGNVGNIGPIIGPTTGDARNKIIYFEGGAYVHGRITKAKLNYTKIIGRGVLSGRDFKWSERINPKDGGTSNGGVLGVDSFDPAEAHVGIGDGNGGNNTIDGVIVCDGAGHGVNIGHDATYKNTKYWGWHPNNDGFRPWGTNNKVDRCFIRGCDDALYNKGLTVTNTIFWPGFNGSIMCMGWDGEYDTENSTMTNNYLIYPEWRNMGNNNGIVMSQIDFNMKGTNLTIKNLYVDGNIPALVNLHTNTGKDADPKADPPRLANYVLPTNWPDHTTVGYVDNIIFENVVVKGKQIEFSGDAYQQTPVVSKSLIKGQVLTSPANTKYMMKNIKFNNVTINSVKLTDSNKSTYFNIDTATTQNILFNAAITAVAKASIDSKVEEIQENKMVPSKYIVCLNPAKDTVFIDGAIESDILKLYNSVGAIVIQSKGATIDVSNLKQGLYILQINNGQSIKIIK
jgi:hypothetical protein